MKPSPSVALGDTTRLRRRPATIYYDRGDIEVTSNHLAIGADFYPLRAISDARVEHRAISGAVLVAATLAPSGIVVVAMTVRGANPMLTGIALAAALGVATTVALLAAFVWPRTHELWIDHDGVTTRVLSSPEEWRVRQLARAVLRALRERGATR
jgi:hypothetical protein